jgi:hypothetical protein
LVGQPAVEKVVAQAAKCPANNSDCGGRGRPRQLLWSY